MKGFQVTFFTEEGRKHGHQLLHEWLLQLGMSLGVKGGTSIVGVEGYGRSGKVHLAHLFSLGDQPVEITMAMTEEQLDALFDRLERENIDLFYVKAAVEYGKVGSPGSRG